MTAGFQKCQSLPLKTHSSATAKTVEIGLSILKPNFSAIACLVEIWAK
jgi:hypothetical protein